MNSMILLKYTNIQGDIELKKIEKVQDFSFIRKGPCYSDIFNPIVPSFYSISPCQHPDYSILYVLHWVVCIVHVYKDLNYIYIYVLYVYLYSWTVLKNTNIQTIIHNCQIQVTSKNIIIIGSVTVISSNPTSMSCPIYNGTLDSFVCSSINQVTPHLCTFEYLSWANLCSPTLYCTANLQLLMIYINYLIKVSREPF